MYTFAGLLSHAPSGLYRFGGEHTPGYAEALCRLKHVELLHVSGAQARGKQRLLVAVARAMHLPVWFGMNWDALADCLTEFAWQPGSTHVLLLSSLDEFARHSPPDFAMLLAILEDAASFWTQHGVRFLVLIESENPPRSLRLPIICAR